MNQSPIPYVTKNPLSSGDPQDPFTFAAGINNTSVEQATANNEFTAAKNMFTDATGGIYVRNGSKLLGGIASGEGNYGVWGYIDNFQNQVMLAVFGQSVCYLSAGTWIPVPGAPTMPARVMVSGVFFAENNSFYLVNGTDPGIKITGTGTSVVGVAAAIPLCRYIAAHNRSLLYMGAGSPNLVITSLTGTDAYNVSSLANVEGAVMGCVPLNLSLSLLITSERVYRLGPVNGVQLATIQSFAYSPSFDDIGVSACVAAFSIAVVNQAAYWVGGDEQNGYEVYRCDGHQIMQIAGQKLKTYQNFINPAQVSSCAGAKYASYYKVSLPSLSVAGGSQEWLFDTVRSGFFYYNLSQLNVVCEGNHQPGHFVSMYADYYEGGKTYTLAGDAQYGCVHRQGIAYQDETVLISRITPASAQFVAVGLQTYFSQPLPSGSVLSTVAVRAGTLVSGSKLTVSVQALVGGYPTGIPIVSTALAQAVWQYPVTQMPSAVVSISFSVPVTVPTGCVLVFSADAAWSLQTLPGQAPEGTSQSLTSLTFVSQSWNSSPVQLALSLGVLVPVSGSVTKTTCLGNNRSKKRTIQMVVTGQSILGASPQLGIGTTGRDSQFVFKTVSLGGRGGSWAASLASPTPPALQFAVDPTRPQANQVWTSMSSSYSQTVFAPMYVSPSVYVSYKFSYTGTSDWRISSFVPIYETYPSTIV